MVVVSTVLFPVLGWGEGQKTTTVITSKTMTASSQKNQAIFRENVKLVQEELVVYSDMMIIYFKEKGTQTSPSVGQTPSRKTRKEIRFVEAKGHVKIVSGESRAICQHALYDKQAEKIILRGSPVVCQAGTRISGLKMTMFLKENRSIVEGDTRVIIEEGEENECLLF